MATFRLADYEANIHPALVGLVLIDHIINLESAIGSSWKSKSSVRLKTRSMGLV